MGISVDSVLPGWSCGRRHCTSRPCAHKREHPSRLGLDHAHLPSGWRTRRYQEVVQVTFTLNWGRAAPSPSSSFQEQGTGLRQRHWESSCLSEENGSLPRLPFPCLSNRLRDGPFLSLFSGSILYKDWGKHVQCLFHACLCSACIPSTVLGTPHSSQVSLLGTGQRREML